MIGLSIETAEQEKSLCVKKKIKVGILFSPADPELKVIKLKTHEDWQKFFRKF